MATHDQWNPHQLSAHNQIVARRRALANRVANLSNQPEPFNNEFKFGNNRYAISRGGNGKVKGKVKIAAIRPGSNTREPSVELDDHMFHNMLNIIRSDNPNALALALRDNGKGLKTPSTSATHKGQNYRSILAITDQPHTQAQPDGHTTPAMPSGLPSSSLNAAPVAAAQIDTPTGPPAVLPSTQPNPLPSNAARVSSYKMMGFNGSTEIAAANGKTTHTEAESLRLNMGDFGVATLHAPGGTSIEFIGGAMELKGVILRETGQDSIIVRGTRVAEAALTILDHIGPDGLVKEIKNLDKQALAMPGNTLEDTKAGDKLVARAAQLAAPDANTGAAATSKSLLTLPIV